MSADILNRAVFYNIHVEIQTYRSVFRRSLGQPLDEFNNLMGHNLRRKRGDGKIVVNVGRGILSLVYDVGLVYIHHRLINPEKSPYIPAPALGWMNNILGGAKFVRRLDSPENVNMLMFKMKDSRYCIVAYQVYPESLFMRNNDHEIKGPDSAPVDESLANQTGMTSIKQSKPIHKGYFPSGSLRYINLKFSKKPGNCYDMWGNGLKIDQLPLDENPIYLVFDAIPEKLKVDYIRSGEIHLAKASEECFSGLILESHDTP